MKKITAVFAALVMAGGMLAGCSSGKADTGGSAGVDSKAAEGQAANSQSGAGKAASGGKLVVYSACNEEILSTLIPMFEEQSGIKVELLTGGAGELLKRVESEAGNPYCDVMLGGSEPLYFNYLDQFQEYVSENDQYMLDGHHCYQKKLTPINTDSSIIMWNTNLIGDIKVSGIKDLLQPELKGKISLPDPATSGNGLSTIADIVWLYGDGDWESEAGWDMVRQYVTQLDGKLSGSSGNAHKSVADGENTIVLTFEGAAFAYLKNGANVAIAYPDEGVSVSNAMMGIVKDCKNTDNAKLFVDFITSKDVQDLFGTVLMSRPVRKDAQLADFMPAAETIKTFERSPEELAEQTKMIIERFNEIYAEVQ